MSVVLHHLLLRCHLTRTVKAWDPRKVTWWLPKWAEMLWLNIWKCCSVLLSNVQIYRLILWKIICLFLVISFSRPWLQIMLYFISMIRSRTQTILLCQDARGWSKTIAEEYFMSFAKWTLDVQNLLDTEWSNTWSSINLVFIHCSGLWSTLWTVGWA